MKCVKEEVSYKYQRSIELENRMVGKFTGYLPDDSECLSAEDIKYMFLREIVSKTPFLEDVTDQLKEDLE